MACWPSGLGDVDRGEQFGKLVVLADQRSDVLGEHLLARHDPEQACFLSLPVRGQFGRRLAQQVACTVQVAAVDRAHSLPTEVGGTLVLRDVVAQQRHLPAPAVVAHVLFRHYRSSAPLRRGCTQGRPVPRTYTGLSQPCNACTHGSNGTRPAPRPTQPIPAQHDPFDSEHSQPGISPAFDHERRVAEPWGFCAACLSGAPRTRSNNPGRTDFEYEYPLGMTTSKSTEVALTVWIRLA